MIPTLVIGAILAIGAEAPLPQDSVGSPYRPASLTIETTPESIATYVNGKPVGFTPLRLDSLQPGSYRVKLVSTDVANWFSDVVTDSIILVEGESRLLQHGFPQRFLINTIPSGAEVYLDDSLAGLTPLLVQRVHDRTWSMITLKCQGYETFSTGFAALGRGSLMLPLTKRWSPSETEQSPGEAEVVSGKRVVPLIVTGAGAVLFGTMAAYFKIQADEKDNIYNVTGDPGMAGQRNRLDTGAAIATIAMQGSIALFIYFLLTD